MDALALLCTLHADGPTTLGALRQQGCHTLDELEALAPELLERTLGGGARRVARFLAEARALEQRVDEDWPEEERTPEPGFPEAGRVEPAQEQESGEVAGRPVIEDVLEHWRRRDASSPPAPPGEADLLPRPSPSGASRPATLLRQVGLDGLDDGLRDQLERAEIVSVEALAEADMLALAASCGQPYTKLLRLQFLARRMASDPARPEPSQPEPGQPSAAAPALPAEESAGGPFA